jgi:hypothetical protein
MNSYYLKHIKKRLWLFQKNEHQNQSKIPEKLYGNGKLNKQVKNL